MIKYLLRKLLGSLLHSRRGRHYRHSSSNYRTVHVTRRYSSSDRGGYGHRHQGHGYYRNRRGSSS